MRSAASQEFTCDFKYLCSRSAWLIMSHPSDCSVQQPHVLSEVRAGLCPEDRELSPGLSLCCLPHLAAFPAWAGLLRALLSSVPFAWLCLCVCFLSHTDSVSFTAQNNKRFVGRVLLSNLSSSFILSLFNVCFCRALNTKLLISS